MNMVTHTSSFMLMIPTSLDPKLGIIYFQALQKDRSKNKLRRSINQSTVCEFVTRFHIRYACSSDKKYVTEIHIYSWVITLIQFRYFEFHTNFLTRCNLQTMNMTKEMGGKIQHPTNIRFTMMSVTAMVFCIVNLIDRLYIHDYKYIKMVMPEMTDCSCNISPLSSDFFSLSDFLFPFIVLLPLWLWWCRRWWWLQVRVLHNIMDVMYCAIVFLLVIIKKNKLLNRAFGMWTAILSCWWHFYRTKSFLNKMLNFGTTSAYNICFHESWPKYQSESDSFQGQYYVDKSKL